MRGTRFGGPGISWVGAGFPRNGGASATSGLKESRSLVEGSDLGMSPLIRDNRCRSDHSGEPETVFKPSEITPLRACPPALLTFPTSDGVLLLRRKALDDPRWSECPDRRRRHRNHFSIRGHHRLAREQVERPWDPVLTPRCPTTLATLVTHVTFGLRQAPVHQW